MRLICYRAMCGDAFHLQYDGESGKHRNILLDMGHPKTYKSVMKDVISNLVETSEHIDALFLSHIHDDHIGGASRFIKDIQSNDAFKNVVSRWIYNTPKRYDVNHPSDTKDGVLCGIVSGDIIYEHILSQSPVDLNDVVEGQSFDIDGMKVTILSPDAKRLSQLREKYSNNRPLCKYETDEASVEAGSVSDDFSTPLDKFKLANFQEDTSVENASSIAAVFEYGGKRILWLSDSVPSVVTHSLYKLGYSETNKIHCEAVLLSHHGSAANNSVDLFKMMSANRYIISADGINRHCLPNKETIARLVATSSILPVSLYFNYSDGRLSTMFKSDDPECLKSIVDLHFLINGEVIEI